MSSNWHQRVRLFDSSEYLIILFLNSQLTEEKSELVIRPGIFAEPCGQRTDRPHQQGDEEPDHQSADPQYPAEGRGRQLQVGDGERDGDDEVQERKGRVQVSNVFLIVEMTLSLQFILYHYEYL